MAKKSGSLDGRAFRGEVGGSAVTEIVEKAPDGTAGFGVTWYPDSTYESVLKETAAFQGSTPQLVAQDIFNWGIANGWTYSTAPGISTVFFSKEQMDHIRKLLDYPEVVTGKAIVDMLMGLMKLRDLNAA